MVKTSLFVLNDAETIQMKGTKVINASKVKRMITRIPPGVTFSAFFVFAFRVFSFFEKVASFLLLNFLLMLIPFKLSHSNR